MIREGVAISVCCVPFACVGADRTHLSFAEPRSLSRGEFRLTGRLGHLHSSLGKRAGVSSNELRDLLSRLILSTN